MESKKRGGVIIKGFNKMTSATREKEENQQNFFRLSHLKSLKRFLYL